MSTRYQVLASQIEETPSGSDNNDRFARSQATLYFLRHIKRYPALVRNEMKYATWLLGRRQSELGAFVLELLPSKEKKNLMESLAEAGMATDDYGEALYYALRNQSKSQQDKVAKFIPRTLIANLAHLNYCGKSDIERNIQFVRRMFVLQDHEIDLLVFLFITNCYDAPEMFFDHELACDQFKGRKYLNNVLGSTLSQTTRTVTRLGQLGVLDDMHHGISLENDILRLLQDPDSGQLWKNYFKQVRPHSIPLDFHFIESEVTAYLQKLVQSKTETPTHLLFHGPPGTGKTSLAHALAGAAKAPVYAILRREDDQSVNRRTAIAACMNMTNSGSGSIIIVDEADNLLNTRNAWMFRGETQDKGWLNDLMEKPGARIIWVTNATDGIEDSVLRRFAYTLELKPFTSRQRVVLFERIVRRNRVKRFFSTSDVETLAKDYRVAAGPMDLAVKKARDIAADTRRDFQQAVRISLDAYLSFRNGPEKTPRPAFEEKIYNLKGLNLSDQIDDVILRLEGFNRALSSRHQDVEDGMAMLFYGPPGTGKTALANYLGCRLDREVLVRRYSDLQSMWVGQGEKNIRDAFLEAMAEEAILIIDEADSMLMRRDRAVRSWEISFTNEFLTQMESFRGILICTTNRLKDLDAAAIRRFTFKIGFDYLTRDGNLVFYDKLLKPMLGHPMEASQRKQLSEIRLLAPGDFKTVRKRFAFHDKKELSHGEIIDQLKAEAKIKIDHHGSRAIGF